jgi:hypothetical protein
MFELLEARRDQSAQLRQPRAAPLTESNTEAMGNHMAATESPGICNELVERQANSSIVRSHDGAGTRANDDVDRDPVSDELLQDAKVAGAAQTSSAEHESNANG